MLILVCVMVGKVNVIVGGTKDPAEIIYGSFRKITSDEAACRHWCVETKGGAGWEFISSNPFKPLHWDSQYLLY